MPHTPSRSPVRLFGRGLLSLPQQPTTPPVFVPLNATTNGNADTTRKWTQEDQDQIDEKARRKAMSELVQSWMDRLQLISVIVSFLYDRMNAV